ncbi:MAG: CbiX/SirB N-terminal domain-containing protein [Dehalococcoidales bacterium]|jgi:sirohydrochlorin cobaltochelatase|nr:CbiX/SirB N-terminal domain-containing protein [Dehalococcoidales bacterium]MDD4793993.1 CbiX/SirB N-terminal domain-containing protein [Dehalococcoidales bacterium]MDD5122681.1 CbiX/SirB N-terminal domain-containing protein [Dehalococcoidales bacterium]MDX9802774.1 CbiX/SirB N-terminal domain-containing protein [Dehalococcoidales bacterium]
MFDMNDEMIVLATHGAPPKDFPRQEMAEFFKLHSMAETGRPMAQAESMRYEELENKMRLWPRCIENDPFYHASHLLAAEMQKQSGLRVIPGFNEFCAPDITQALESAIEQGARKVVVVTPMLTRGGMHAEVEIAQIVEQVSKENPDVCIAYAWPFQTEDVAQFLLKQVKRF